MKTFFTILLFFFSAITNVFGDPGVVINEVLASNGMTNADEDGDNEDWIELYNSGDEAIDLSGYGLSDDYDNPFRWIIPAVEIGPGEFLLIWASGKDRNNPDAPLHTNFSISQAGEEVIITDPEGNRVDELQPTEIPTDISYGRYPDGEDDWIYFEEPTPGAANTSTGFEEIPEPVSFSHSGGFHVHDFDLTLMHPDPDVTIIYTLDGSEPDPGNLDGQTYNYKNGYPDGDLLTQSYQSHEYSTSIAISDRSDEPDKISRISTTYDAEQIPYYFPSDPVPKGTVIRARAVKDDALPGEVTTHTYFVTPESNTRYGLPVISINVQEDYLFDYENGIYVAGKDFDERNTPGADGNSEANYQRRGREWEYPASFELFEKENTEAAFIQDIGIRIHGGWSRTHPMKSLRLYARNDYGQSRFNYQFFTEMPDNRFNRLVLRNSGNDYYHSLLRDAAIQSFVKHMNFDTQAYRPFLVFLNGEYWGIHNMRERYDKHYLERVYGVDPDNVDILTANAAIKEGDPHHFHQTINYIETNGLSDDEHYEYIQTRIDTENFIDYQIAQIYAGNTDWPGNNIDYWRHRTSEYQPDSDYGHDGRWRWLLFDTDFGFNIYGSGAHENVLSFALQANGPDWPNPPWSTFLLRKFMENTSFRNDFINRFADQLNTAFLPERVIEIIQEHKEGIEPEIGRHIERWGVVGSLENWNEQVEIMINYANARPEHQRRHLSQYFNSEQIDLTVNISDPDHGRVKVNTFVLEPETTGIDDQPYPWTGTYFEEVPVTLTAMAEYGYAFSHWEANGDQLYGSQLELDLSRYNSVKAIFIEAEYGDVDPEPFVVSLSNFSFNKWDPSAETGRFPDHMAFVYMDEDDPGPDADIAGITKGAYNLDSRTRITGLGDDGISFINTGNEDGNPGYPGRRLGGVILALDTSGEDEVYLKWTGGTVTLNSREYRLRLQYRTPDNEEFRDIVDWNGSPVEYVRRSSGDEESFGPIALPEDALNQRNVQLFWRYYHTGERFSEDSGARDELSLVNVYVSKNHDMSEGNTLQEYTIYQNYPNPFNPETNIRYGLPEESNVKIEVYDVIGNRVATLVDVRQPAGHHTVTFDATELASGMYIYLMQAGDARLTRKMLFVK